MSDLSLSIVSSDGAHYTFREVVGADPGERWSLQGGVRLSGRAIGISVRVIYQDFLKENAAADAS